MSDPHETNSGSSKPSGLTRTETNLVEDEFEDLIRCCDAILDYHDFVRRSGTDISSVFDLFPLEPYTAYQLLRDFWDSYHILVGSINSLPSETTESLSALLGKPWDLSVLRVIGVIAHPLVSTERLASKEDSQYGPSTVDELPSKLVDEVTRSEKALRFLTKNKDSNQPVSDIGKLVRKRPWFIVQACAIEFHFADLSAWPDLLVEVRQRRMDLKAFQGLQGTGKNSIATTGSEPSACPASSSLPSSSSSAPSRSAWPELEDFLRQGEVKGKQERLLRMLIEDGGKVSEGKLFFVLEWNTWKHFESCAKELNTKLKKVGYRVFRLDNHAQLKPHKKPTEM